MPAGNWTWHRHHLQLLGKYVVCGNSPDAASQLIRLRHLSFPLRERDGGSGRRSVRWARWGWCSGSLQLPDDVDTYHGHCGSKSACLTRRQHGHLLGDGRPPIGSRDSDWDRQLHGGPQDDLHRDLVLRIRELQCLDRTGRYRQGVRHVLR